MISASDISMRFGQQTLFENVSVKFNPGCRYGLIGANGSGKSSILKLICGQNIPYTGDFRRGSGLKISYVAQDASQLQGSLSELARESGIEESLLLTILAKLDVPKAQMERDLSSLSAGQKKKVLLAKSICEPAHLHIWDEPMNYIDVISRMQIEQLLVQFQPTLLFVEHDKTFCQNVATKIIEL